MDAIQSRRRVGVDLLLAEADLELVCGLLGEAVGGLLDLLESNAASADHLRAVAASACDFDPVLGDAATCKGLRHRRLNTRRAVAMSGAEAVRGRV